MHNAIVSSAVFEFAVAKKLAPGKLYITSMNLQCKMKSLTLGAVLEHAHH